MLLKLYAAAVVSVFLVVVSIQILCNFLIVPGLIPVFKTILLDIWNIEEIPEEWNLGRLIVLTKKGDLSQPKNYRGIMLLEIAYKVLAMITQNILSPIVEQLDHKQKSGFRPNCGCV